MATPARDPAGPAAGFWHDGRVIEQEPVAARRRPRPRVVVLGAGFGGLHATLGLAGATVDVVLVDRDNYHGFWPLLYQVATAGLAPEDIAHPIRAIVARQANVAVRRARATAIDLDERVVQVDEWAAIPYDYLVVAVGSSLSDYGIPGVRSHAFGLKTLPEAVRLRNHILGAFEAADSDPAGAPEGLLTFVLAGGGPTGVEMAGALAELIGTNLAVDFPHLDVSAARVVVLEATSRLLNGFSARSQAEAYATLVARGVEVLLDAPLAEVTEAGVRLVDGRELASRTVVWTAGVRANPLADSFATPRALNGTVEVEADLSLPGHPEVFVIGDMARRAGRGGAPLPQLAQVAIQGGRHAARSIGQRLEGRPTRPFRYHNHGIMATIGRRSAVAELPGGLTLRGTLGWLSWLGVHLVFLVGFRNRVVVLFNWAWNYLTWDRASRVLLEEGDDG